MVTKNDFIYDFLTNVLGFSVNTAVRIEDFSTIFVSFVFGLCIAVFIYSWSILGTERVNNLNKMLIYRTEHNGAKRTLLRNPRTFQEAVSLICVQVYYKFFRRNDIIGTHRSELVRRMFYMVFLIMAIAFTIAIFFAWTVSYGNS